MVVRLGASLPQWIGSSVEAKITLQQGQAPDEARLKCERFYSEIKGRTPLGRGGNEDSKVVTE